MAEELVDELLGGTETEKREGLAAIGGSDAAAMAMAMDEARRDPALSARIGQYLDRQGRLVEEQRALVRIQLEHFAEDRQLDTEAARRKRFLDRLKILTQVSAAALAAGVAIFAMAMVVEAAASRSVVVEPFTAPPALASRGVGGELVAAKILDTLRSLQSATRSTEKTLAVKDAWSSDIKVEVPETGVSIGEVDRFLRQRFGHDLHIGGDLVQTDASALALTVRGGGVPAKTFAGGPGDLDALATQAAEYVYGRSQPFQFATYLVGNGRAKEALVFLAAAYARAPDDAARARLANVWGNAYSALDRNAEAAGRYRLAMALAPPNWRSWGNLVGSIQSADGEEAGWRESQRLMAAAAMAPSGEAPNVGLLGNVAIVTQDFPMELAALIQDTSHSGGTGALLLIDGPTIAEIRAHLHDPVGAQRALSMSDPDNPATRAVADLLAGYGALERNDAAAAVPPLERFWRAWLADPALQYGYNDTVCYAGLAYGLSGRLPEAEAVFRRALPFARCFALHGDVLEHAGDLAGAERTWAQGLAIGPDLSPVYLHRGFSEMRRGDLARAAGDLAAANARSPHWADPLKAWGDVLARQGRWREALTRYDAALRYAPAWAALRAARETAAHQRLSAEPPTIGVS